MRSLYRLALAGSLGLSIHPNAHSQQLITPPAVVNVALGAASGSDPTLVDGIIYFTTSDGLLHGRSTTDGSSVPGFPVDFSAAAADGAAESGRPVVYYGDSAKGIYLVTRNQTLLRVNADGTVAWTYRHPEATVGSVGNPPAVTPDGYVFVRVDTSAGAVLVRVRQSDGQQPLSSSVLPLVGTPSVVGSNVFVGTTSGMAVLDRNSLVVKASLSTGLRAIDPYVAGPAALVAGGNISDDTAASRLYRLNSATLLPDEDFGAAQGTHGYVNLDEDLSPATSVPHEMIVPLTSAGKADTVYIGGFRNGPGSPRVCAVNIATGAVAEFPTNPPLGPAGSLTFNRDHDALVAGEYATVSSEPTYPGYIMIAPIGNVPAGITRILLDGWPKAVVYDPGTRRYFSVVSTYTPSNDPVYSDARLVGFDAP
jgi:hypothetical protein